MKIESMRASASSSLPSWVSFCSTVCGRAPKAEAFQRSCSLVSLMFAFHSWCFFKPSRSASCNWSCSFSFSFSSCRTYSTLVKNGFMMQDDAKHSHWKQLCFCSLQLAFNTKSNQGITGVSQVKIIVFRNRHLRRQKKQEPHTAMWGKMVIFRQLSGLILG